MSISTHVLDAVTGRPAAGVHVVLEVQTGPGWAEITARDTGADGRIADLAASAEPAVYRLRFDVERYFAGTATFYPEIVIVFRVTAAAAHHHVPLLVSPFAYSTYRGS